MYPMQNIAGLFVLLGLLGAGVVTLVWLEVKCPGLPKLMLVIAVAWWLYSTIFHATMFLSGGSR